MKKGKLYYFIIGTLLWAATGCSNGGVEVGNPSQMAIEKSANRVGEVTVTGSGYNVFVKKELDVTQVSEDEVLITNESHLAGATLNAEDSLANVSRIRLITLRGVRINSMSDLKAFAESRRNINWVEVTRGNLKGFAYEDIQADKMSGEYYFLLDGDRVLYVSSRVFSAANGLVWVAPIVSTIQPISQVQGVKGEETIQSSPTVQ